MAKEDINDLAGRLYDKMPNAPKRPGQEPMNNDEWEFCLAIAREILDTVEDWQEEPDHQSGERVKD